MFAARFFCHCDSVLGIAARGLCVARDVPAQGRIVVVPVRLVAQTVLCKDVCGKSTCRGFRMVTTIATPSTCPGGILGS
ncbi:hypothetical protein PsYK624_135490 [Phanerochaete sordida]|uniref:Uncharacterized protein n=1 Tax=Phanerochaete sordida TaxID=48140 RepID=A0A9P3LJH4_9APHY|nr:hypothetical protein PsYK624_135490 [Phanerochaete sordida]